MNDTEMKSYERKLALRVTDTNGGRISLWRSLARTALKFVPWELSHTLIWNIAFSPQSSSNLVNYGFVLVYVLIGLNLTGLILTKRHQTIHDLLAKTYIVKQVG
jgi:RDD family.